MNVITLDRVMAVQADYIRCIDSGTLESWPEFFVEDCLYKVTTAENERNGFEAGIVYADSKGMLADRILALREANVYEQQTLPPHRRPAEHPAAGGRRGRMRDAFPGDAHHA